MLWRRLILRKSCFASLLLSNMPLGPSDGRSACMRAKDTHLSMHCVHHLVPKSGTAWHKSARRGHHTWNRAHLTVFSSMRFSVSTIVSGFRPGMFSASGGSTKAGRGCSFWAPGMKAGSSGSTRRVSPSSSCTFFLLPDDFLRFCASGRPCWTTSEGRRHDNDPPGP